MMIMEDKSDEWLNGDKFRYVVYYPNGDIRAFDNGCVFSWIKVGFKHYSGFMQAMVIVAEKSGDGKRIWLEMA